VKEMAERLQGFQNFFSDNRKKYLSLRLNKKLDEDAQIQHDRYLLPTDTLYGRYYQTAQ
jgi:hypothetical protein